MLAGGAIILVILRRGDIILFAWARLSEEVGQEEMRALVASAVRKASGVVPGNLGNNTLDYLPTGVYSGWLPWVLKSFCKEHLSITGTPGWHE